MYVKVKTFGFLGYDGDSAYLRNLSTYTVKQLR
jgi:hypothetical protein